MYHWKQKISSFIVIFTVLGFVTGSNVLAADKISAKAYVLMEAGSGRILSARNESEKLPMASTTKIMTTLIALEQPQLDEPFIVDENALKVEGSSMGLLPGDSVTMRDLCYGMMLPSGNDAANAAAVKIAGSIEQFAEIMNQKAGELGMKSTNFITPSGLHNDEHYSTAYDMALLAREALKNPDFAEICQSEKAKRNFGNPPYQRWMTNHNKLLDYYEGCIGLKTGFTKKAGRCLVSAAQKNGITLICVTLNAPSDWNDHISLYDYGFSNLKQIPLTVDVSDILLNVVGAQQNTISLSAAKEVSANLTEEEKSKVTHRILLPQFVYAPVKQGDVVGCVEYLLDGKKVAEAVLTAAENTVQQNEKKPLTFWEKLKIYFEKLFSSDD